MCAVNICLGIVTNHHRMFRLSSRDAEGIVKEELIGLVHPGILTQDNMVKVIKKTACTQFAVLNFMKTIAADAHVIASLCQIFHQVVRSLHHTGLHRTEREEAVTHLQAEFTGGHKPMSQ